jgi:hypothetical protein
MLFQHATSTPRKKSWLKPSKALQQQRLFVTNTHKIYSKVFSPSGLFIFNERLKLMNMQNEKTLLDLGFKHYPEWDSPEINSMHYRLEKDGLIFRAKVWGDNQGYHGSQIFVGMGIIIRDNNIVDRWRDCCSTGSVERKVDYECKKFNKLG